MKTMHFDTCTLLAVRPLQWPSRTAWPIMCSSLVDVCCHTPSCHLCSVPAADNIEALHDWCKRRFDGMGEQLEGFFMEVRSCICTSACCLSALPQRVSSLLLDDVRITCMSHYMYMKLACLSSCCYGYSGPGIQWCAQSCAIYNLLDICCIACRMVTMRIWRPSHDT